MAFRGQYDCSMDDKGRIKMPATLRKQFPAEDGGRFIMAKDLEDCLVIYPVKTWEKQEELFAQLNPFSMEHRGFINALTVGYTEMEMDNADRFLVVKSLMKYLGNSKSVVLKGNGDRIQLWDAAKYEQYIQRNIANIEMLAQNAAAHLDKAKGELK